MDARVACELALEVARERRVQLEEEQFGIGRHPARDLARVDTFTRPVLSDHARFVEIHLARHPFHELPNVIVTPHNSGWTQGMVRRRWDEIADNIGRCVRGETLINLVANT